MECLTSKYAAMKLLSFYIHIKNIALLLDWADQKHSLSVRKITRADYLEWMLQWPPRLP